MKINQIIKSFLPEPGIREWLFISSGFSLFLLLVRMSITSRPEYFFLPWNLILAFIPYLVSNWMKENISLVQNRFFGILVTGIWLLFLPNSFYIITDLFHLKRINSAPGWFDLLLVFSFAVNGLVCGILSLRIIETVFVSVKRKKLSPWIIFFVMNLTAMGIYIGRYLRFNSWDIISDPVSLLEVMTNMIFDPFNHIYAWGMIICYAIFMTLLYFLIRKLGEFTMVSESTK